MESHRPNHPDKAEAEQQMCVYLCKTRCGSICVCEGVCV
jgi:hypothetical protein